MALTPTVLTDALIIIGGNTISDHGNKIELPITVDGKVITTFGQTWQARTGGLKDANVNISLFNDFVAAQLDAIMFPLIGTVVTFETRATSAARGPGNPGYTGSVLIDSWTPLSGQVGDVASVDVSWPTSGAILRQTS